MKRAIFGNYGVKNLGDDLILMGLQEQYPSDELIIFCGKPQQVTEQFGVEAHHFFPGGVRSLLRYLLSAEYRKQIRSSRAALRKCDYVIIGGGGILVDRFYKAIFLWWRQLREISKLRKPFAFLGVSFELKRSWTRKLFRPYLQKASEISVRDKHSQQLLKSMQIESALVKDFAFQARLNLPQHVPQKKICLALCRWGLSAEGLEDLRSFVSKRKHEGYQLVGLAFQTEGDDDRELFHQLDECLRVETDLDQILSELSSCQLLVGMRFHSLILAQQLKLPLMAIAYQDKVSSQMKEMGLSRLCLQPEQITTDSLEQCFRNAIEGRPEQG